MTADLFIGGLAVLTLAAIIIVMMTTDRTNKQRTFNVTSYDDVHRRDRADN